MALSILHRASAIALYGGMAVFAAWLWALATNGMFAYWLLAFAQTIWGEAILFLFCWTLLHHLFGGVRHFFWDIGLGFSPRGIETLAWGSAICPLLIVIALWWGMA